MFYSIIIIMYSVLEILLILSMVGAIPSEL